MRPAPLGGELLCRGRGAGWSSPVPGEDPPACVEDVVAGGGVLCWRTSGAAGCPPPETRCVGAALDERRDASEQGIAAPVGGGACFLRGDGAAECVGGAPSPPSLAEIAPVAGADGGPTDACAWGAGGIRCWGSTPEVSAGVPAFAACPADVDASAGFACATYQGFDVVDCWGALPAGVGERTFLSGPGEELAVGDRSVCVRTVSGLVRCWGSDATGALGVPGDGSSRVEVEPLWPGAAPEADALAAGPGHVIAVNGGDAGTRVLGWGDNDEGEVCTCEDLVVETPTDAAYPAP